MWDSLGGGGDKTEGATFATWARNKGYEIGGNYQGTWVVENKTWCEVVCNGDR